MSIQAALTVLDVLYTGVSRWWHGRKKWQGVTLDLQVTR